MIYIKVNENNVTLAGTVANQQMIDDGYVQYTGPIPTIGEFQSYQFDGTNLIVVDENEKYSVAITQKIQNLLDEKAQENKWDDMKSARAAAGIPLTGSETATELSIRNEAILLAQWYLKVWAKAIDIEADIKNGVITRPTIEEFISQLPLYE